MENTMNKIRAVKESAEKWNKSTHKANEEMFYNALKNANQALCVESVMDTAQTSYIKTEMLSIANSVHMAMMKNHTTNEQLAHEANDFLENAQDVIKEYAEKAKDMGMLKGMDFPYYQISPENAKAMYIRVYHDTMDVKTLGEGTRKTTVAKLYKFSESFAKAFQTSEDLFAANPISSNKSPSRFDQMLDKIQEYVNEETQSTSCFHEFARKLYDIETSSHNTSINPRYALDVFDNFNMRLQNKMFLPISPANTYDFKEEFASKIHGAIKEYVAEMKNWSQKIKDENIIPNAFEKAKMEDFQKIKNHIAFRGISLIDKQMSDGKIQEDIAKIDQTISNILERSLKNEREPQYTGFEK